MAARVRGGSGPLSNTIVGIDASRNRSGGAQNHLVSLLTAEDPRRHGIAEVHVWAYRDLADRLPDAPWLIRHNPSALGKSLAKQLWWQRFQFHRELGEHGCHILLSTDAGTIGTFEPSVVMSRDMLSYEPGEMARYRFSFPWFRLLFLRYAQARALRRARGAIFLTRYATDMIERHTGPLRTVAIIPHGVGLSFRRVKPEPWVIDPARTIRCVYVSNTELYKHQWNVVYAVGKLKSSGVDLCLNLVGGGTGLAQARLERAIREVDPEGRFIFQSGNVPHDQLPGILAESDIFIFASSCENMPNTLVEGMATGLPIACSDRGPMPEVLQDGGVYFDPENVTSIAGALTELLTDPSLRRQFSARATALAEKYSWERCANETWKFIMQVLRGGH